MKREETVTWILLKLIATLFVIKLHSGCNGIASEVIHYICGVVIPLFVMTTGAILINKDKIEDSYVC